MKEVESTEYELIQPNPDNPSGYRGYHVFQVSVELYDINHWDLSYTLSQKEMVPRDMGINLTAVVKDETVPNAIGGVVRFKHHSCNLTGGVVEYKVRIGSQVVTLSEDRSDDRFLETL